MGAHRRRLGQTGSRRAAFIPAGSTLESVSKSVRAALPTPIRSRKQFHRFTARPPPVHVNGLLHAA